MIRRYTISPPLHPQPGDTFAIVAGVLEQRRGGGLVAFRVLSGMPSAPLLSPEYTGTTLSALYLEEPVPAYQKTITGIEYDPSGTVLVKWSDGGTNEYSSRAALVAAAGEVDSDDLAKKLLLRAWLHRSPDGSDPTWAIGTTIELDLSSELNPLSIG